LDLSDKTVALPLAKTCGGTVTIVDATGDAVGRVQPRSGSGSISISAIQKMADAMENARAVVSAADVLGNRGAAEADTPLHAPGLTDP
jgi:hypothetical protein